MTCSSFAFLKSTYVSAQISPPLLPPPSPAFLPYYLLHSPSPTLFLLPPLSLRSFLSDMKVISQLKFWILSETADGTNLSYYCTRLLDLETYLLKTTAALLFPPHNFISMFSLSPNRASAWTYQSNLLATVDSTAITQSNCSTRPTFPSSFRAPWSPTSTSSRRCWPPSSAATSLSTYSVPGLWVYRSSCTVKRKPWNGECLDNGYGFDKNCSYRVLLTIIYWYQLLIQAKRVLNCPSNEECQLWMIWV